MNIRALQQNLFGETINTHAGTAVFDSIGIAAVEPEVAAILKEVGVAVDHIEEGQTPTQVAEGVAVDALNAAAPQLLSTAGNVIVRVMHRGLWGETFATALGEVTVAADGVAQVSEKVAQFLTGLEGFLRVPTPAPAPAPVEAPAPEAPVKPTKPKATPKPKAETPAVPTETPAVPTEAPAPEPATEPAPETDAPATEGATDGSAA